MKKLDRRNFLKLSGSTLIGVTLGGIALRANAQEKLSLDNAQAVALKYTHKSEVEGKTCGNCKYIQGEAGAEWRPCGIFPGKLVNANGWCQAWMAQ
ncbi:high-potential iron-sulfur protein [Glaciecola sp. 1036]|uniref:high-potential iron-sulfur protein n=1 Tax=Alteromonadaceae TaxID=72275 RepID=UPI003D065C1D